MEEEKEELLRKAVNLTNSANDLTRAILDEDIKDITYWQKSIKDWQKSLDKKLIKYLEKLKKEEIPF